MSAPEAQRGETSDEEILSVLRDADWPLGSTEVGDAVGVTQQAAYNRLRRLAEEGQIERKMTGGTVLWRPV
jgi:DNA-binding Lrp family transcriptional regulator